MSLYDISSGSDIEYGVLRDILISVKNIKLWYSVYLMPTMARGRL